jgi:hypothetical protein
MAVLIAIESRELRVPKDESVTGSCKKEEGRRKRRGMEGYHRGGQCAVVRVVSGGTSYLYARAMFLSWRRVVWRYNLWLVVVLWWGEVVVWQGGEARLQGRR